MAESLGGVLPGERSVCKRMNGGQNHGRRKSVMFVRGEVTPPEYSRYFTGASYVSTLVTPSDQSSGRGTVHASLQESARKTHETAALKVTDTGEG